MREPISTNKRPESVLVVVYTQAGEVLLLERRQPLGFWQSVTGSLEWGEPPWHAAKRELVEETGLLPGRIRDLRHSTRFPIRSPWRCRYAANHHLNREHWFALGLPGRQMVHHNEEHRGYRWLPWQQACLRASSHTNRSCIEQLFRGI